jgi:acetyl-CoA synthetase
MSDKYVWQPTQEFMDRSNIGRFMHEHGIASYHDLIARSTADIEWFWNAVIDDLGIEFYRPFDRLLDTSGGIPWSRWFIGGQINLVHNWPRQSDRGHLGG